MAAPYEYKRHEPSWEPEPLPLPADDPRCRVPDRDRPRDAPSRDDLPGSHVVVIDLA